VRPWTNVLVPRTNDLGAEADIRVMQAQQLKSLVEAGHYKPQPALVAEAMLQRRGVRELLAQELSTFNAAGRTPPAPTAGRHAA
jgi:hypothetical protein